MRNWLFRPLVFYPLLALVAAAIVLASLRPDLAPAPAAAAAGRIEAHALILQGEALTRPEIGPGFVAHVRRDAIGRPEALRIAVAPGRGAPRAGEEGVRILLSPDETARLGAGPYMVEVDVRPVAITMAQRLAVNLQDQAGATAWEGADVDPEGALLHFALPANGPVTAIGLRPVTDNRDYNYGFEIASVRLESAASALRR